MQKKNISLFLVFLGLIFPFSVKGFFEAGSSIDLYNTIADGYEENSKKNYEFELTKQGTETVSANVNKIIKERNLWNCLKEGLDSKTLAKITAGNINDLFNMAKEECKTGGNKKDLSNEFIASYVAILTQIEETTKRNSRLKTKKTYDISRIWLYSDGNTNNSPFDLVDDLKQIEKIIFSEEIEYKGVVKNDFSQDFNNNMSWIPLSVNGVNHVLAPWNNTNITIENTTGSWNTSNTSEVTPEISLYIAPGWYHSNYVCSEDSSVQLAQSGFSKESIDAILASINTFQGENTNSGNTLWITSNSGSTWKERNNGTIADISAWYAPVNDNVVFPCTTFFCINIEMVIHNQNLLWGWNSWSIESILKYSNETLKRFSNTSLLQSKMTSNNFEMWLLDLKLPDMFHMGVQIQKRSPPILNIENPNGSETSSTKSIKWSEYAWENLLEDAYRNFWLEYQRANSLDNFKQSEPELKSVIDSAELPYTAVNQKINDFNNNIKNYWEWVEKTNFSEVAIQSETDRSSIDILKNEFIEIEKFWEWLKDYSQTFITIIKGMNKIPTNK